MCVRVILDSSVRARHRPMQVDALAASLANMDIVMPVPTPRERTVLVGNRKNKIVADMDTQYSHCIVSLDVGIVHLGMSVTLLDESWRIIDVIWVSLTDVTTFPCGQTHGTGPSDKCPYYHDRGACDWIAHFIEDNRGFFEAADVILIERQPPTGLVGIEQILFAANRAKAHLVSPNSVHKFHHIGDRNYIQRKVESTRIATELLMSDLVKNSGELVEQMGWYVRQHDIGDSLTQMLYWISKKQAEYDAEQEHKRFIATTHEGVPVTEWFSQYESAHLKI